MCVDWEIIVLEVEHQNTRNLSFINTPPMSISKNDLYLNVTLIPRVLSIRRLLKIVQEKPEWERTLTVLGPIPLKWESSVFTSSTVKPRRYSKHKLPLSLCKRLKMFLIKTVFFGANPPHLIAFSTEFGSATKTYKGCNKITFLTKKQCKNVTLYVSKWLNLDIIYNPMTNTKLFN